MPAERARCSAGPDTYSAQHGGYEAMLAHHRHLAVTAAQRHRLVSLLSLAADDARLPADPEFRSAVPASVECPPDVR